MVHDAGRAAGHALRAVGVGALARVAVRGRVSAPPLVGAVVDVAAKNLLVGRAGHCRRSRLERGGLDFESLSSKIFVITIKEVEKNLLS